ncbi:MAG: oligosaccharide flippase family protein [Patescibacteria group bacterium]|nr:oligosaccharide flippase family protein [Patescibacteria group bacterium]
MVGKFLSAVGLETKGLHTAAYLVAVLALFSQLLGMLRDRLLAASFGAGHILDIYYAAFRIPDFLFATIASLLSIYAVMPILSELEEEREGLMLSFMRQILFLFFVSMAAISGIIFFFVPEIVRLTAPGLVSNPASAAQIVLLVRILLLQPILLGLSNVLSNLTQLRHRFLLYSISPLLYNLGIIFGVVALYPFLGVAGLGLGVVLGALLHMLIQVPFFFAEGTPEPMPLRRAVRHFMQVIALSLPRTFALASTQVSLLALTAIASLLASGSIAIFSFAYNLQAVPFTIIGVSYSVAAFPTLARLYAKSDHVAFSRYIESATRHILFWSIPATVFIIVLRAQLVRVILGAGIFDWTATRLTAAALALFVLSLVAQNVIYLMNRAYYAMGNTLKPVYWGVIDIVVSIASSLLLVVLFNESSFFRLFVESLLRVQDLPGTTILMLAFGYALGSICECAVGLLFFFRDFSMPLGSLRRLTFESFAASVIGASVSYGVLSLLGGTVNLTKTLGVFIDGLIAGIAGLIVTTGLLYLFKNQELREVFESFHRRLRSRPPALEPSDIAS